MTEQTKLRGVNLGGWLVLEKWMTPSLFASLKAIDEYTLCQELGKQAGDILKLHRDHFIAEADFAWIASQGLNAVRLPVGYWIFGDAEPYVGGIEYVDRAMQWAETYQLRVILDLHGAPGSQNGNDHSGRTGKMQWKQSDNIAETLLVLEKLAERYKASAALAGIEVLNEPSWKIGKRTLKRFYDQAYMCIRKHCGTEVSVIIPDAFQPRRWKRVLTGKQYANVMLDVHFYQIFSRRDKKRRVFEHLDMVLTRRHRLIAKLSSRRPVMIGEWSGALAAETLHSLSEAERAQVTRTYLDVQLMAHATAQAWFYWSYKTEQGGTWSYRDCVERGLLPDRLP